MIDHDRCIDRRVVPITLALVASLDEMTDSLDARDEHDLLGGCGSLEGLVLSTHASKLGAQLFQLGRLG